MITRRPTWALSALVVFALTPSSWAIDEQTRDHAPSGVSAVKLACEMSAADLTWIGGSLKAWRFTSRALLGIRKRDRALATFFDDDCVLSGRPMMGGGNSANWSSHSHNGTVPLPDGKTMPAVVTSFAAPFGDDDVFFVMSTPSVWRKGNVQSGLGLETLMTAVLIHEMGHTVQFATYGQHVSDIENRLGLGRELTDDILQDLFGANPEYAASVSHETDLLYKAAAAPTDERARKLALAARHAIEARRARWLVGKSEKLREVEDLFLTLEGSGQWAGYAWLTNADGAGLDKEKAIREFGQGSRFWSQNEGLAMFLVIDRLLPDWKAHAFGDGALTALEMLRIATNGCANHPCPVQDKPDRSRRP